MSHYSLYTIWHLRSCTGNYISSMNKSQTPLPLTPSQVSEMHNHIVDDSFYGLSVSVCGWGGGSGSYFEIFIVSRGISCFFQDWERFPVFRSLCDRDARDHHLRPRGKKMVIKSSTSLYEDSFNNTAHYHGLKRYNFSCCPFILRTDLQWPVVKAQ